jgi:hypothetical protein
MDIHPVDSNQHMLNPQDIFLVAAHEDPFNVPGFDKAAKEAGMSHERLRYTLFINEYSDPRLLRIRAGNTLFTILAFPGRVGFVRAYNGDTGQNFIKNLVELFDSARAMGFDQLLAQPNKVVTKAIKLAMRQNTRPDISSRFDTAANMFVIKTGKPRTQ